MFYSVHTLWHFVAQGLSELVGPDLQDGLSTGSGKTDFRALQVFFLPRKEEVTQLMSLQPLNPSLSVSELTSPSEGWVPVES